MIAAATAASAAPCNVATLPGAITFTAMVLGAAAVLCVALVVIFR
jgi:hypothetical protein